MNIDLPSPLIHVLVGILADGRGRVLLGQRPPGRNLAGMWEFPGGKREAGETPQQALARELDEELGIRIEISSCRPLCTIPWLDGERRLHLDVWRVRSWQGHPASLDQQTLQWRAPRQIDSATLTPADRSILQTLRLPPCYPVTPAWWLADDAEAVLEQLRETVRRGTRLLQLRFPAWPRGCVRELARRLLPTLHKNQAQLLLNADIDGARQLGPAVGVHLQAGQLVNCNGRPLPWNQPVAASCHDGTQLAQAVRIGADFATLSPVLMTDTHPQAVPLGWPRFGQLARTASLPVYALGGVGPEQLHTAQQAGGQGVAGIRAFFGD